jgi:pectate lyase
MNTRLLVCFPLLVATASVQALPAFPGAGGGGANTVGGRGGAICEVTNLNDSGSGSLRACIERSGPRIVVFRVGGTIQLASTLAVSNPYLTIAGQTAPGGGILLSGKTATGKMIVVFTHDVIVRYLRMRHGYNSATQGENGGVAEVLGGHDVIFDHCSVSWTQDESMDAWGGGSRNITFSWNFIAEALVGHSTALITGAGTTAEANQMTNIDAHHNFIANTGYRIPLIKNKTFRFVNNIVYNWNFYATQTAVGANVDIIGNLYKAGPLTLWAQAYEIQNFPTSIYGYMMPSGNPSLYVVGNKGPRNANPDNDNWVMVGRVSEENGSQQGALSTQYKRTSPLLALPVPIPTDSVNNLESVLLPTVGASQRLDCNGNWILNRDSVDARIIQEYNTNRGIVPNRESEVGGFPTIANGTPCTDTDHDGIPDAYEDAHGLNKNSASDGPVIAANGYSNVENYLNSSGSATQGGLASVKNLRIIQP